MLRIANLTYRIGDRLLFDGADASIDGGHRVGLVGRNGTGKTTLLKLITGALEPQDGRIDCPARWRIGMTAQEAPGGARSLLDTVLDADRELARLTAEAERTHHDPHRIAEIHERLQDKQAYAAPARAARILDGLGFDAAAQQRPCSDFSGGWRMRVALAGLLFTEPDLLLLDEPTNHLDLEASLWLEDYLARYPGTVLLISHDRGLLERAVDSILHLSAGKLTLYAGGYDRFEEARRMRAELDDKLRTKQQAQRARIQAFVDRFRYKATKAKQAQSRLKMLARMQPIAAARDEDEISFAFPEPLPLPPPLLSIERVAAGYDGTAVLREVSLRLDADDRVALLGANGNGKSTLLKLLAGRLTPLSGAVSRSGKLRVGYFAQHQAEELDLQATPLLALARLRPRETETALRAHLGRFGFSQQRAETCNADLSGGEKARLLFALITAERPHLLLLDEPGNHLDMTTREALVQALNDFAGAIVIVSHDAHMLQLVADRFWTVGGGAVQPFEGDLDDYRASLLDAHTDSPRKPAVDDGARASKRQQRRQAAERQNALAPLKRRLSAAEDTVSRLERERARLLDAMADPALYDRAGSRLPELQKELAGVARALQTAEDAWADLQDAWDRENAAGA